MLSTAYASRTHVKASQTDFHVKPDNSSGLTHDSPSKRPLRTKTTFQPKKAAKSIEDTKPWEDHPSQARTDFPPCLDQIGYQGQGPKGNIEVRPVPPPCPEPWTKLRRHQVRPHGSMTQSPKPSRLGSHRSRLSIPLGWDWLPSRPEMRLPAGAVLLKRV